jgi:hypothetical protein
MKNLLMAACFALAAPVAHAQSPQSDARAMLREEWTVDEAQIVEIVMAVRCKIVPDDATARAAQREVAAQMQRRAVDAYVLDVNAMPGAAAAVKRALAMPLDCDVRFADPATRARVRQWISSLATMD